MVAAVPFGKVTLAFSFDTDSGIMDWSSGRAFAQSQNGTLSFVAASRYFDLVAVGNLSAIAFATLCSFCYRKSTKDVGE